MTYILGEWVGDRGGGRQRRSKLGIEMELQEKKEIKIERRGSTDINIIFFIGTYLGISMGHPHISGRKLSPSVNPQF